MKRVILFFALISTLFSAEYTFTRIVESRQDDRIGDLGPVIAINANGVVAFSAELFESQGRPAGAGIFTGSGGALSQIADTSGPFQFLQVNSINDSGTVLFQAILDDFNFGLFTGSGGPTNTVILSTAQERLPSYPTLYGDIASNGAVVYRGAGKIVVLSNGTARTIANSNTPGRFEGLPLSTGVRFNRSGSIVFSAFDTASRDRGGVFTDTQGTLRTIAEDSGPLRFTVPTYPSINDDGTVVMPAFADGLPLRTGVYAFSAGKTDTVVATDPPRVVTADINNAGTVAFVLGTFGSLPAGIYTGPDLVKDKVIEPGDPLFGSTLTSFGLNTTGGRFINDRGQIVFAYQLASRRVGIAVATPVAGPGPSTGRPVVPENAIVDAASLAPSGNLSPGAVVSIYGSNLANALRTGSGPTLPTVLDGVSVTFNGIAAPLYFVAPGQINAQIPYEVSGSNAEVRVRNEAGESEPRTLNLTLVSPAIYTSAQNGSGQAIVVNAYSASLAAPSGVTPDSRPARAGDALTIYANGLGAVSPSISSGINSCGGPCNPDGSNLTLRRVNTMPSIIIGGTRIPANNVLFAGLSPDFVGLYQINFIVPEGLATGNAVPILLEQGTARSRTDVTIAIE